MTSTASTIPMIAPSGVEFAGELVTIGEPNTKNSKIDFLLRCFLYEQTYRDRLVIPRLRLRIGVLAAWSIAPGQRILDIGCGQGESTVVLASELDSPAHITGVDTAPQDYGNPFTIGESHAFIQNSVLGQRITFICSDTASLLRQQPSRPAFDAAVLCHSLWYFPSLKSVFLLFESLANASIKRIYVAEYDPDGSSPSQAPHVLAMEAQALLWACQNRDGPTGMLKDELNIRAAPNVATILEAARNAGYSASRQGRLSPEEDFQEGHAECLIVQGQRFRRRVAEGNLMQAQEAEVLSYVPRVKQAIDDLKADGIETVRSMNVWWVELVLN